MKTTILAAAGAAFIALGAMSASTAAAPTGLGASMPAVSVVTHVGYYDGDWRRDRGASWRRDGEERRWWWWRRHHDRREAWRDRDRNDDRGYNREQRRWR